MFKKFRVHLSEFVSRLIASSADTGSLYKSDLMGTLQTWVIAMNSSQIRSFRHTATVVALELQSALCDVARKVEKEVETVGRQREGEKKRRAAKGGNDKMGGGVRDKELERKMREVNGRKTKVTEFINEFDTGYIHLLKVFPPQLTMFASVFIHRYRDLDPVIRAECVTSLGVFFKKLPSLFLTSNYLRYVGWVLSDVATNVRLAAVKSLQTVYALSTGDADHLLNALNHFTERFKARLLEMAEGDIDIGVRVGVLNVLGEVDKTGLLEEDDRHRLCRLIFSEDPKVRKAVAKFVKTVWEEWIDEYVAELEAEKGASASSKKQSNTDRARIGYKGLAALLVKWGKALDEELGDDEEENGTQAESQQPNDASATLAVSSGVRSGIEGRVPLAVEALWDDVDPVTDWEGILNTLLLDHTASGNQVARSKRAKPRSNGKKRRAAQDEEDEDTDALQVDDAWRLEEIEETSLLQIMTASLRKIKKELVVKKVCYRIVYALYSQTLSQGEEDAVWNDLTRALIKGLPRLFIKYQTDKTRIAEVLVLPTLMNLDLYMEMRMLTVREHFFCFYHCLTATLRITPPSGMM
jgi:cohesin complex subunit SA-1/2